MNASRLFAVLAILALANGCSGSKSSEATTANPSTPAPHAATITDPCKLLTQDEASALMGAKVNPGELKHFGSVPYCRFLTASQDSFNVEVEDPSLFDSYTHDGTVPVSGIGDKAAWQHTEIDTHLFLLKGSNLVSLALPRTMKTMTPAVEHAAKLIAGRM